MNRRIHIAVLLTSASLVPGLCHAQSTPRAATAVQPPEETGVKDIVVTATRRTVNLQAVPAVVDVASAAKLDTFQIKGVAEISQLVAGVQILRNGGVAPYIRGVGSANSGFSAETPVAFYVDGLYIPNNAGVLFAFNNIERVEVLKGPQGTLYGRNTTGGLINVITRNPTQQTTVDASVSYANYNTFTGNFYGSGAITSNLSASAALYARKQYNGWGLNVTTGNDVFKDEEGGAYLKLLWQPGPDTKVTLGGLMSYNSTDQGRQLSIFPGTTGLDGSTYLGRYRTATRIDASAPYYGYLGYLRIDQTFSFGKFFSLTGAQSAHQFSSFIQNGIKGQPLKGQTASGSTVSAGDKNLSEELQLSSNAGPDKRLDWIVGAFYFRDVARQANGAYTTCVGNTCAPGAPIPSLLDGHAPTRSISGYADGTYRLFSATHLTVGLRYTHETKSIYGRAFALQGFPNSATAAVNPLGAPATAAACGGVVYYPGQPFNICTKGVIVTSYPNGIATSVPFSKLTYRFVLAQDIGENVHAYASYNYGFRSGTFVPSTFNNPATKPEELGSVEVGVKSELFDRRLRLNLAAFHYNYTDLQVASNAGLPIGTPSVLSNAASARVNGIDAQFDIAPTRSLAINGGFEILDAKFSSYPGATCTSRAIVTATVLGGVASATCNLTGYNLQSAPHFSGNVAVTYTFDSPVGEFILSANDSYKSRYSFTLDSFLTQNPTNLVGASVKWISTNKHYDIQVFGKNLTDRYYFSSGSANTNFIYAVEAPRTYGIVLGYHY